MLSITVMLMLKHYRLISQKIYDDNDGTRHREHLRNIVGVYSRAGRFKSVQFKSPI